MVVSFNRSARGQNTLRHLLAPVVKEIMDDKSLVISTSPVEVYKAWVNQLEMQTGEARYVQQLGLIFGILKVPSERVSLSLDESYPIKKI